MQPSISDYLVSLENSAGVFRTLGDVVVDRDLFDLPAFRSGNSAAVFTYTNYDSERRFLKLYIRPNLYLRTIYDYVEHTRPPLLPAARLLKNELWVMPLAGDPCWVDVVEGAWTPGVTLDVALSRVEKNAEKNDKKNADNLTKARLVSAFDRLCSELRASEWAHGDLKPENIIVNSDKKSTEVRMSLIDCDAMWIPALAGLPAVELGTPGFRHPARTANHFDKTIDDYPMQVLKKLLSL